MLWVNICAIVFSAVIAVLLSNWLTAKREVIQRKHRVLEALVAYRYKVGSDEFLRAINSIPVIFKDYDNIEKLYTDFYNLNKGPEGDRNLTKLILEVCKVMGYKNIKEETIIKVFTPET